MNPYEKLAQQIQTWDKQSGNANKRRMNNKRGFERWETIRPAFKWLVEIDELSAGRRNLESLLDALWAYMVIPEKQWNSNDGASPTLGQSHLGHLETLAEYHSVDADDAKTLTPHEITVLRETMELIKSDLLDLAEELGKAGERLQALVNSCLALLDEETVNDAAVRAKTEQIFGAAIPASFLIEDEEKQRGFVGRAARALGLWASGVAASTSTSVAGQWIAGMITGEG